MRGRSAIGAIGGVILSCLSLLSLGCSAGDGSSSIGAEEIRFRDDAVANAAPGDALSKLEFVDPSGKSVGPGDYLGKKNLVLVITRGYNGSICPYCSTYTSSLIANYPSIAGRDAEVVLVYPIEHKAHSSHLREFLDSTFKRSSPVVSRVPFPIVLDVELKGVEALGLRKNLSKPATYIIDKKGQVRFAYVGSSLADRPSIKVILKQLDAITQEPT